MKYYPEYRIYDNGLCDVGYNVDNLPTNKPVWAVAYDVNNDTRHVNLKCLPVLGEIRRWKYYRGADFYPYKKGTTEVRLTGKVHYNSRVYADTYEEAVQMYNELIKRRIETLYKMIEEAKDDFIAQS